MEMCPPSASSAAPQSNLRPTGDQERRQLMLQSPPKLLEAALTSNPTMVWFLSCVCHLMDRPGNVTRKAP